MRTQLYIGIEAGIIQSDTATQYLQESSELSKMLQGLINKLAAKASV